MKVPEQLNLSKFYKDTKENYLKVIFVSSFLKFLPLANDYANNQGIFIYNMVFAYMTKFWLDGAIAASYVT